MLKKFATLIGLGAAAGVAAQAPSYSPYRDEATSAIYNLLFCDDIGLYKAKHQGPVEGPWKAVFAAPPDPKALQAVASNAAAETRLRVLAYNALRRMSIAPARKELLGVIVEVGLDGGLDTLAAYQDGRARYINHAGKIIIWEARDAQVDDKVRSLLRAAETVVQQIGPWEKPRLSPPTRGMMRLTFLVADGLYFGEGPMSALQNDPLGGQVVSSATALLVALTERVRPK